MTFSRSARISSTPLLDAPSISCTSSEEPLVISRQLEQTLQGVAVGPFSQLSDLARILATDVLPTPRGPLNKKACATRPLPIALLKVLTTCS